MFEWDECWVNVNGGVIVFGYLIGVFGCWILVFLVYEMVKCNVCKGLVMFCIGGGQGVVLIIECDE